MAIKVYVYLYVSYLYNRIKNMASLKFYPEKRFDKEKKLIDKNVPILMSYCFNNKRLMYYTQERVDLCNYNVEYWKHRRLPVKAQSPQAKNKNANLETLRLLVENISSDGKANGIVLTPEYIKAKLDEKYKDKVIEVKEKEILFHEALAEYMEFKKKYNESSTYKKLRTTKDHLEACFGASKFKNISFKEVDNDFIEKFKSYLIAKDFLNNTVVKYLHIFRTFLIWCRRVKKCFSDEVEISGKPNDIDVIFLDSDEIDILKKAKMPNESLERVKDIYLFGYYTSMRYKDLFKLKKDNIDGNMLNFFITKNHKTVTHTIPLIKEAKDIIVKYKDADFDMALPVISNQKMNDYIKEVMKAAGFDKTVIIARKKGNGEIVQESYKKYQLISCHSSRKSFISGAIAGGMQEIIIKSISGHSKNSRAFGAYYNISNKQKHEELERAFNKKATE